MYSAVTMKRLVESRDLLVAYFDAREVLAVGLESEPVTSNVLASPFQPFTAHPRRPKGAGLPAHWWL